MAEAPQNINVTVNLSDEDRELLRSIARALGVKDDAAFTDTTVRFVEPATPEPGSKYPVRSRPKRGPTLEQREVAEAFMRSLTGHAEHPAEGDWQLNPEADHTGEETD